jgi:septal ring factor EnvC (AmiA/AmiB activator)
VAAPVVRRSREPANEASLPLEALVSLRARPRTLLLALAAVLLLPSPAATGDERDQLKETSRRLGHVESVLRDARADAGAVATALAEADREVAGARQRLDRANARLDVARQRRAGAAVALDQATDEVAAHEARLAEQVRGAYMTGRASGLAMVVDAHDLGDLVRRTVTLSYVLAADQDVLDRLDLARRRAGVLHDGMVEAEREQAAATAEVAGQVRDLERVRALRRQAKERLDARIARLAGAAAALRARSSELRELIRQEELARQRAAAQGPGRVPTGAGGRCDLSGTSAAERWIIMRESSGYPTADNPTSTAFGLGQLLLGNRILYLGKDYATTDCGKQLWAFRAYVRDRYGTAERAMAFWQANGWY